MFLAANPWSFSLNSMEPIIDLESVAKRDITMVMIHLKRELLFFKSIVLLILRKL